MPYIPLRLYETPVNINLIKVHFTQNTFTSLEISNLTIFDPPKNVLKDVGKVKVIKALVGIKLIC